MPKNSKVKKNEIKMDFASTVYLQVVGSGAKGAPRSLFLFTESHRYFFNCGEGTQRLTSEHKIKLSMTKHIFITHNNWENIGGLLGILLTLQDAGVTNITVHGPPGIESFCNDTKDFMHLSTLKVTYHQWEAKENVLNDGPLHIKVIPIGSIDDNSFCAQSYTVNEVNCNESETNEFNIEESIQKSKEFSLAYVCRPSPKPGTLLADKCQELGVPVGPLMGELKKGLNITLPNGKIVEAKEVTEPPDIGTVFIVVDVRNKNQLNFLSAHNDFRFYQKENASGPENIASVVIHFTPVVVVEEPLYQTWIKKFGPSTVHIFINEKSECMGSESVHRIQYKLNHLYPESFPLLKDEFVCNKLSSTESNKKLKPTTYIVSKTNLDDDLCLENLWQSFTGLTYHIRPHLKLDTSKILKIEPEEFIKECYAVENFESTHDKIKELVQKIKDTVSVSIRNRFYPYILFLGTGSCIPNKTRNTSGIALFVQEKCTVLLDCGEGTYGQMIRLLGKNATEEFLCNLSLIYISHLHADHHIGLLRVLLARKHLVDYKNVTVSKLYLMAPKNIINYLRSYDKICECLSDSFTFIPNHLLLPMSSTSESTINDALRAVNMKSIKTCFVYHCPQAFGVAFTFLNNLKITYSGDTMPCQNLVTIGEDCDLLIHEATMEDELHEEAKMKRHSTTSEAMEIGDKMRAKHIILTHFSQRYAKVPFLDNVPNNVIIAFDNMIIHLYDLPCLPHLYPSYKTLFSEDINEILKKRIKLQKRKADLISSDENENR